ncbi:hypothetical protein ABKV19_017618 [Rosa sericea]
MTRRKRTTTTMMNTAPIVAKAAGVVSGAKRGPPVDFLDLEVVVDSDEEDEDEDASKGVDFASQDKARPRLASKKASIDVQKPRILKRQASRSPQIPQFMFMLLRLGILSSIYYGLASSLVFESWQSILVQLLPCQLSSSFIASHTIENQDSYEDLFKELSKYRQIILML